MFKNFVASITHNAMSLIGTAIAIASVVLIISLAFMEHLGFESGPYMGILTFLVLPMFFVIGLILIPVGAWLYRRKLRRAHTEGDPAGLPVFDLNVPKTRNWLFVLLGATMVNIVILAGATYKGVEVMESVEFCGLACHSVMEPEHTAYLRSSHTRVSCAECHIGPGADWFVKSKISGAWQLISVAFDLYSTPIPTPLHDLRPAQDTCEQCHWPAKHVGDKLAIRTHFDEDEANTKLTSALLLKVGGAEGPQSSGIHWHVDRDVQIRYRSDGTRENIYEVEYRYGDGEAKVFKLRKAPEGGEWRTMDCVDCHTRPSHKFYPPDIEVDNAMRDGLIDTSLPFAKRESLRVLDEKYESHEAAREAISTEFSAFYVETYPDIAEQKADAIEATGKVLGDLYSYNVFPQMEIWWNTYPEHIGHETSEGCFRCHTKGMRTEDRESISKDCDLCHTVLAEEEENPEILTLLNP